MLVVTAQEMREMDRLTIHEYGVPSLELMERAGEGVARAILERFGRAAKKGVLIVAGKGNNGGDGLVIARYLKRKRIPCEVILLSRKEELSPDAAHNLKAYRKIQGKIFEEAGGSLELLARKLRGKGLVVDAILGTGLTKEVRGSYAETITLVNSCGLPVVAVDIPSGLDSDFGRPMGSAIQAEMTVTLGYPKLGQVTYPGLSYVGDLVVAEIGIHSEAVDKVAPKTEILEEEDIGWLVPVREPDTHKGTYGHLVVIAGSRGKTGAAILACRAALRIGAGLVTLAAPRSLNDVVAGSLVEVMTEPLKNNEREELEPLSDEDWRRFLDKKNALLFGPGIGLGPSARTTLNWLLRNLEMPWVIDADGLNHLAAEVERLRGARTPPVLTPHPGEMARLIGKETSAVSRDRVGVARSFAVEHRCFVVLKGARTVMATPEGRVFINPTGNPGMASGGMGDVLAGMLAGLLGQGLEVEDALKLGVYLHGFVADRAAEAKGEIGLIASDVIEGLPEGLHKLAEGKRRNAKFKKKNGKGLRKF